MKESIENVLNELEIQSSLEKSRKIDVIAENRMLAITKETGEMLNIILRLNNVKICLRLEHQLDIQPYGVLKPFQII